MLRKKLTHFTQDERGVIIIIVAILMAMFVATLALILDMGHMHGAKSELQHAGDACALRGARAYFPDDPLVIEANPQINPDVQNAIAETVATIAVNYAGFTTDGLNKLADLPLSDIAIGVWDAEAQDWFEKDGVKQVFSAASVTQAQFDSVWPPESSDWGKYIGPGVGVITRREGELNAGEVPMTLVNRPPVEIESMPAASAAVATLGGAGGFEADAGVFPIAVNRDLVMQAGDDKIFFSPDMEDVGGWTSLTIKPASANNFKRLINGELDTPELNTGDLLELQNGVACSVIKEIIDHYDLKNPEKADNPEKGVYEPKPPIYVIFPVVDNLRFNQDGELIGGMAAHIVQVRDSTAAKDILIPGSDPPKYTGDCMLIIDPEEGVSGRVKPGGAYFGLLSTVPKLVR